MITILLLCSRDFMIEQVINRLKELDKPDTTKILIMVDGDDRLYVKCRNLLQSDGLVIKAKDRGRVPPYSPKLRRFRIADLHNEAKQYVSENSEYILLTEDDTILPKDALYKCYNNLDVNNGFTAGMQIGRWGTTYIGAWLFDDLENPKLLKSLMPSDRLEKIHASGFYCLFTKTEYWRDIEHKPLDNGNLGPDLNFGVEISKKGLENTIDFSIDCEHYDKNGLVKRKAQQITLQRGKSVWSLI